MAVLGCTVGSLERFTANCCESIIAGQWGLASEIVTLEAMYNPQLSQLFTCLLRPPDPPSNPCMHLQRITYHLLPLKPRLYLNPRLPRVRGFGWVQG